jgi:hypothetical protein
LNWLRIRGLRGTTISLSPSLLLGRRKSSADL